MTEYRRPVRLALLAGGWGLMAVATVGEATDGFAAALGDIAPFALLLAGVSGLALASLGASIDVEPAVLDRRLVGFSIGQRQLLRYAGVALGVGIPAGVAVSVVGGGLVGAALTLAVVVVGLLLLGVVLGRSVRHAIALRRHEAGTDDG